MADEKKFTARLTRNDDEDIILEGDESKVKAALMALGELFLSNDAIMSEQIDMVVDIGEELLTTLTNNVTPEQFAMATKIFTAAEEYGDPRASDLLSTVQTNPLVVEAMWLRAADRNAPCPVNDLQDDYKEQAAWWRKKIADAEGKPFDGEAPSDSEIFLSDRMKFIDIYRRALSGDVDAMKLCLDFCEEEAAYWGKRNP